MKNLLFLYSAIWDFVAESFIQGLHDLSGEDVTVRINSPGGSVFAGWGMIAAIKEFNGKLKIKVDGVAASMAFYILLFCDNVECSDTSSFMVHRAFGRVDDPDDQKVLDDKNNELKSKMKKKFDATLFLEVAGITIDDLFKEDKNIWLNAKQAKKLGIVSKINRLEPSEQTAFKKLVACGNFEEAFIPGAEVEQPVDWNKILMNIKN